MSQGWTDFKDCIPNRSASLNPGPPSRAHCSGQHKESDGRKSASKYISSVCRQCFLSPSNYLIFGKTPLASKRFTFKNPSDFLSGMHKNEAKLLVKCLIEHSSKTKTIRSDKAGIQGALARVVFVIPPHTNHPCFPPSRDYQRHSCLVIHPEHTRLYLWKSNEAPPG